MEKNQVQGVVIEAGCALGGSAILISKIKKDSRAIHIYDTFSMIPSPSVNDDVDALERYEIIKRGCANGIKGELYYGYEDDLLRKVKENFNKFKIDLSTNHINFHKGLFQNTMKINSQVALAHIDSDWYDSIITCLHQIVPKLATNGMIVIDDYYDWRGARQAIDDYFRDLQEKFEFHLGPQLVIRKV